MLELSELEQDILFQLETKANKLSKEKGPGIFSIHFFFKSEDSAGIYFITVTAYAEIAEIAATFRRLVKAFGGAPRIINFDVRVVDKIPRAPISSPTTVNEIQKKVDELTESACEKISPLLPQSVRGKKDGIVLLGPVIKVNARVVDDSTVYDFSSEEETIRAVPLAFFLHRKAVEIGGSLVGLSLDKISDLEVMDVIQREDLIEVYVQHS